MTGQEALRRGATILRTAGIEDPELESSLLLRHALQRDRVFYYVHLPEALTAAQEEAFLELVRRRSQHRPAAYLTGVREFYGIEFYVAPGVLIPRPETELLVEQSLRLLRARSSPDRPPVFVDVGTGSGAVVVAVAKASPNVRCFGFDRSTAALQIAALNAKRPGVAGRIELLLGDLLSPLPCRADVIAANLPYIPTLLWQGLPLEIRDHEPREALDGGPDGLDAIRRLISATPDRLVPAGALLLEVGAGQAGAVLALLRDALPDAQHYAVPDLAGIPRVVVADRGAGQVPGNALVR
jgi:release factor glutamine methyltransferase